MSTDKPDTGRGDDPNRPGSRDHPMSREEFNRMYPPPSPNDSPYFPRRRPPPDAFPRSWPEDSPNREIERRDRVIEAREQTISDRDRRIGSLEESNDRLRDENTQLKAENERLKSREVPRPDRVDSDESNGFANRDRPRGTEGSLNEKPEWTWIKRPPSDKATAFGVAALSVANEGAVLGHVMSSDLAGLFGGVVTLGGAAVVLVRDRWEKKHGD